MSYIPGGYTMHPAGRRDIDENARWNAPSVKLLSFDCHLILACAVEILARRGGHKASETMPTDACQFFYDCKGCRVRFKPEPGDYCVFCSYGSVPVHRTNKATAVACDLGF